MIDLFISAFVTLFVVIDPPGRAVMCPAPDATVARVIAASSHA